MQILRLTGPVGCIWCGLKHSLSTGFPHAIYLAVAATIVTINQQHYISSNHWLPFHTHHATSPEVLVVRPAIVDQTILHNIQCCRTALPVDRTPLSHPRKSWESPSAQVGSILHHGWSAMTR